MKALLLIFLTLCISLHKAAPTSFLAKEEGKIIKQIGLYDKRYSPFSTFKIVLALIGFDAGILKNTEEPIIEFTPKIEKEFKPYYKPDKYPAQMLSRRSTSPTTYMKYSIAWYSHMITQKLGMPKFEAYIKKLNYGNCDVSGTPGKNDGLSCAWLNTSLLISPLEQVEFLEKLLSNKLPLSAEAQLNTIKIMYLGKVWDDWELYGKTGGGKKGWFVGWIKKNKRCIVFAQYIEGKNFPISSGKIAKELALDNLISVTLKVS